MEFYGRSFEDEQPVRDRWWKIRPGDVVVDVGANEGSYTLPALADGASMVYAFNPGEADAQALVRNLDRNKGYRERCEVVPLAVGSRLSWFDWDRSALTDVQSDKNVRAVSLDIWMEDRPDVQRVDWLKVDAEGAELGIVFGAEEFIRRFRPSILVENHLFISDYMEKAVVAAVRSFDLGYEVSSVPWHSVSHSFFRRP